MIIKQFEDKSLSHFSYAILSNCASEIVVIDPARDISPYMDFALENNARIIGIIETHPHADFVSGHLELSLKTGATIYCSGMLGASYTSEAFDEGAELKFGKIRLRALNTPGHSPDSISIVLEHDGKDKAVFTGDTLFIGDCGRPDLRENAGNLTAKREELAKQMFRSLRDKLMKLNNDILVYPAHGAGTLCGKSLSSATESTIGAEKDSNWSLQEMSEEQFVRSLTSDQPFIPKYFGYDVALNRNGAPDREAALNAVQFIDTATVVGSDELLIVDTRAGMDFKRGHLPYAINIQVGGKFETWLGSVIAPEEQFYLLAENEETLETLVNRTTKIGYEPFIKAAVVSKGGDIISDPLNLDDFMEHSSDYTIVDVRNPSEVKDKPVFSSALHIPVNELRERVSEIPTDKPIVVHCAAGYRSAIASSIIANEVGGKVPVYDMGEDIRNFLQ